MVVLHEIDFLLKVCCSIPGLPPLWRELTWIYIFENFNHCKKIFNQSSVGWFLESLYRKPRAFICFSSHL